MKIFNSAVLCYSQTIWYFICYTGISYVPCLCYLEYFAFRILDKLELTRNNSASTITSASTINRNNSASTNSQVYLLISLRRPLYFDYDIEFVDNIKETVLDTMEGTKGATRLSHTLPVRKGTEVMARFQIGGVRGPNSNPVAVDEQNLGMLMVRFDTVIIFLYMNYRKCRKPLYCVVYSGGHAINHCTIGSNCSHHLCAYNRDMSKQ